MAESRDPVGARYQLPTKTGHIEGVEVDVLTNTDYSERMRETVEKMGENSGDGTRRDG